MCFQTLFSVVLWVVVSKLGGAGGERWLIAWPNSGVLFSKNVLPFHTSSTSQCNVDPVFITPPPPPRSKVRRFGGTKRWKVFGLDTLNYLEASIR